ncbi:holo-ACP synthase [Eubacteriales bacterium OttesenSCG-928-N13]|nr:holo-ACP synthase [Eubacteriales bacterium OttesenSCG-928-N13]
MVIGVGTDLMDVARMETSIQKEHFLERIFTASERERIAQRGAETAAGFFAAKEAVAKALGTGFSGFSTRHIEIRNDDQGKPLCTLTEGALERFMALGGKRIHISISHADGFAVAFCVMEGSEAQGEWNQCAQHSSK